MLIKSVWLTAFFLALALAFCAAQGTGSNRIVIGGKAVAMVADAAYLFPQAGSRVIAVAGVDQGLGAFLAAIDPPFAAKPSLDRSAGAEAYAALAPDLVLLKSSMKKSLGPSLDALSIAQLYLDLETPEDYLRELEALGEAFGDPMRAKALAGYYAERLGFVTASLAAAGAAKPRVLVLQAQAAAGGAYEVPPASWMQTIMVERAGGSPLWKGANPGSGWARVGPEQIAAWNPDIVFLISYREKSSEVAEAFRADPRLAGSGAIAAGRVYAFPQDFYSWDQPDTRWILGLEWMAKKLHPEVFSSLSIRAEAERFFSFCYGIGKEGFATLILPRLSGDYGD